MHGIFDIFTNFFTSILIGYLALTNSLADRITAVFPQEHEVHVAEEQSTPPSEKFENVASTTDSLSTIIPRILLDHADFQRAATIASSRPDEFADEAKNTPISDLVGNALVNIYCQYKTNEYIRTTTGTGFFINPKGIILTNAHVAQFLLLSSTKNPDHTVSCVIRTGNPAVAKYHAELLYISPTWVFENADVITQEAPRGTGERDYALLYISKSIDNTPLPTRFPAIPVDTNLLARNTVGASVITAGYPAEVLMRAGADAKLLPIIASTTVRTLYTFGSNYADVVSISESPVGEQGASGGPIVDIESHGAIGLIVTKGDTEVEGIHSLRALTLSYIDRTITEETGFPLTQNMQGDLAYRGSIFKKAMVPFLAQILNDELAKSND